MAKVSVGCLRMIQNFEGLRLRAYIDAAGVLTIGYGHIGPDVKPNMVITKEEAADLLCRDLKRFEEGVQNALTRAVNPNQFDALVSLAYNIGLGAFKKSTLLHLLNAGDEAGAAQQFERWTRVGRQVLKGLVKRRAAERALFEKE